VIRTLGVDLAAQDVNTAACTIEWVHGHVLVDIPIVGVNDDTLIELMADADWTGIDAPFGWPDDYVQAISAYAQHNAWPAHSTSARMRHRTTDTFVRDTVAAHGKKVSPLSVSSDRIAVCAWRCAHLLTRFAHDHNWTFDRLGVPFAHGIDGPTRRRLHDGLIAERGVVEVYPAAALAVWGLRFSGYKTRTRASDPTARIARETIFNAISRLMDLEVPAPVAGVIIGSDHALDAFVSALVAYAAATGETHPAAIDQLGAARREGWIHLPYADSLAALG
jgi:hypothetical protein